MEEEEEKRENGLPEGEEDYLNDQLDAIWLIPGMLPDPMWEYTMSFDINTNNMRALLYKAVKMSLKDEEYKTLSRALKIDSELVFHIGMTP